MKKTRMTGLLLALLMLCGTVALFSSCAGTEDGAVTLSGDEVEIDLSGYSIVYAADFSQTKTMVDHVLSMNAHIKGATGCSLPCAPESSASSAADAPEIDGKVYFRSENRIAPGSFVKVKVRKVIDYDLFGNIVTK